MGKGSFPIAYGFRITWRMNKKTLKGKVRIKWLKKTLKTIRFSKGKARVKFRRKTSKHKIRLLFVYKIQKRKLSISGKVCRKSFWKWKCKKVNKTVGP